MDILKFKTGNDIIKTINRNAGGNAAVNYENRDEACGCNQVGPNRAGENYAAFGACKEAMNRMFVSHRRIKKENIRCN